MKLQQIKLLLILIIGLTAPLSALSSGSYISRPPVPGMQTKAELRAQYLLGKRLFYGKVKLELLKNSEINSEKHRTELAKLQKHLPNRIAKKKDMTSFVGKLTDEQLKALNVYINKRFNRKQSDKE